MPASFHWYRWNQLTPDLVYAFLKLRSDIFVVEQNCVFPDMDGVDPRCEHLCGCDGEGQLLAYLRLLPPGVSRVPHQVEGQMPAAAQKGPALGRVVIARSARGSGLGRELMLQGLRRCDEHYAGLPVLVSAQQHLEAFYASLGFVTRGAAYLEDGIPHVDMLRPAILAGDPASIGT